MSTDTDTDTLEALTAEEQAQFDSMREPGSNASSPREVITPAEPILPVVDKIAAEPAPMGEPEDDDVETIKDATGKDVLDKAGKPQKRVSFHKYQRLETRLRDAEGRLTQSAEERTRIDERLKIINEALTTPAPGPVAEPVDEDPEPDIDANIFEHNKWLRRQIGRQNEAFTEFQGQVREQNEEREIANSYRQDANRFARSEPMFGNAYAFLLTLRQNQLKAAGWDDQKKIDQQIVKEEKGLVRNAIGDGKSPAERIFEMAKAAGFTPPAPKAAEPVPGALDGKGPVAAAPAAAAVPAVRPAVPSVKEQVELAAQGAAAATSLSSAGGAALEPLTAAKLLSMDEDEFNEAVAGLSKAKLRELFGD